MRILSLTLLLFISLYSIEITITPEKNITVTNEEAEIFKASLGAQRIMITPKRAKEVLSENRYLAEEYLKTHTLPKNVFINFKLEFEKNLASEVIKEIEKQVHIDDETTLSYYVSHPDEFKKPIQLKLFLYRFESFTQASNFYETFKNKTDAIVSYINENNISKREQSITIDKLDFRFQNMIKYYKKQAPYLLAPQFFYDHYTILYIQEQEEQGTKDYKNVKEKIKNILHRKAYKVKKSELLAPYKKENKN
jgi:hypothetical protein